MIVWTRQKTMTSTKNSCSVCLGEMAAHMEAICDHCAQPYHLNQRTDLPGEDCGQVWINEEHLALEFACNTCLHPRQPEANLEDILDMAEAALFASVDEDVIAAAADAGMIRHRRTPSGVYLFERRDILTFLEGRR
jgi:hypothetical protein